MSTRIRLVLVLTCVSMIAGAAVVPYQAAAMPEAFAQAQAEAGLPLAVIAAIAGVQTGILAGVLGWIGLRAGDALGLGAPVLEAWLEGRAPTLGPVLARVGVGILLGLGIAAADVGVLLPLLPDAPVPQPPPLLALGATLYGAVVEEILLRVFVLGGLAWLLSLPARRAGRLATWEVPAAVVLAALLFGIGHLPTAAAIWPLTPLVVARIVGLNLLLGIPFGLAYTRVGLLAAMALHGGADLGLHVIPALVLAGGAS